MLLMMPANSHAQAAARAQSWANSLSCPTTLTLVLNAAISNKQAIAAKVTRRGKTAGEGPGAKG